MTPEEADKVTKLVVLPERKINPAYIGKDVQVILREIGIELGEQYRLAIFEAHRDHPLVWLEGDDAGDAHRAGERCLGGNRVRGQG